MDVPAILAEVFNLEADDIITQKSPGEHVLTHTIRLTGGIKVIITQPIPQRQADPLWSSQDEEERLLLTAVVQRPGGEPLRERVLDRDELIAFLSMAFAEEVALGPIIWTQKATSYLATPEPNVLLRVMSQRGRQWTWAIVLNDKVLGPEDFKGATAGCRSAQEAEQQCEAAYRAYVNHLDAIPTTEPQDLPF